MQIEEAMRQITTLSEKQKELLARFQSAEIAARKIEQRRHKNQTHFDRVKSALGENGIEVPYGYDKVLANDQD